MEEKDLIWKLHHSQTLIRTPVLELLQQRESCVTGLWGDYIALRCPDWVMVIPELGEDFLLVRQWRHAARCLTLEFPGGVREAEEDPAQTAARELEEETGFRAGKLRCLGVCNPNPALFSNSFHCYLAQDLICAGGQKLDADELLRCERRPIRRVLAEFGSGEFSHALMGTALAFYLRR